MDLTSLGPDVAHAHLCPAFSPSIEAWISGMSLKTHVTTQTPGSYPDITSQL